MTPLRIGIRDEMDAGKWKETIKVNEKLSETHYGCK